MDTKKYSDENQVVCIFDSFFVPSKRPPQVQNKCSNEESNNSRETAPHMNTYLMKRKKDTQRKGTRVTVCVRERDHLIVTGTSRDSTNRNFCVNIGNERRSFVIIFCLETKKKLFCHIYICMY